jgi:hypothetical protein
MKFSIHTKKKLYQNYMYSKHSVHIKVEIPPKFIKSKYTIHTTKHELEQEFMKSKYSIRAVWSSCLTVSDHLTMSVLRPS